MCFLNLEKEQLQYLFIYLFICHRLLKIEMCQLSTIFCDKDLIEQLSATNLGSNFCHPDPFRINQRVILVCCQQENKRMSWETLIKVENNIS